MQIRGPGHSEERRPCIGALAGCRSGSLVVTPEISEEGEMVSMGRSTDGGDDIGVMDAGGSRG